MYFCTVIKQVLHKSFSITLAILVLFSTVSLTVEKHFCGDNLIDVALFSNAKTCGMEMEKTTVETSKKKKPCCTDEIEVVQGQDVLKFSSFEDLDFEQQLFLASFVYSYTNLFEGLPEQIIPHKDYSPPNIIVDLQLVNDTFLI